MRHDENESLVITQAHSTIEQDQLINMVFPNLL